MAVTWIYGVNSVSAAVQMQPDTVHEIWFGVSQNNQRIKTFIEQAGKIGICCQQKTSNEIQRVTKNVSHQNIAALCDAPVYLNEERLIDLAMTITMPRFLVLDCINDPRNLGACLRTAEACGIDAVVITAYRSAHLTPVAIKAASGAAARIPVARVTNLSRALQALQAAGVWLIGASVSGAVRYDRIDYRCPVALVLGSEGKGLRRLTARCCDHLAAIPMFGEIESLNVSVAAAVLLYEMRRQTHESATSA